MEELQLTLTPARVDQRNFGIMLANWRVGQVLNALVVDQRPNAGVLLSVGGKQFVATTDIPVQPGMRMALEVKQMGPEIVLRVASSVPGPQGQVAPLQTAALAGTLAPQHNPSPANLLGQLQRLPPGLQTPELVSATRALMDRALVGEQIKPSGLRQALQQSGLFTEAQLQQGDTRGAQASVKQPLQRAHDATTTLLAALAPDTPEAATIQSIREHIGSVLAGITQNQLASLPSDDGLLRWVAVLPVALGEQVHDVKLRIEQDGGRSEDTADEPASWRVNLALTLPALGEVTALLELGQQGVSVVFRCADETTTTLVNRYVDSLTERLELRELLVARVRAMTVGANPADADSGGAAVSQIDIKV